MAKTQITAREPYVPVFDNPYTGDGDITDFEYETDLVILRMRDPCAMGEDREADYVVAAPYTVRFKVNGDPHAITVPAGMMTDLVSVPRGLRWLVERVGPHLEAAIVHDFLFIAWAYTGEETRPLPRREDWLFANRVMIAGLRTAGVPAWMCWAIAWALSTRISWNLYANVGPVHFIDLDTAHLKTAGLRAGDDDHDHHYHPIA